MDKGKFKAGWGIAVEDAVAIMWQAQGHAIIGPDDLPLKKGNLGSYVNCYPANMGEKPAAKTVTPPVTKKAQPVAAEEDTNKQDTNT